jgi:hypothetical protein
MTLGDSANLATIAGVIGIALAWLSYRQTIQSGRASHMNALFRDFLRLEFDFFNADDPKSLNSDAWRSLFSYKMWVLEEIWIWVDSQRFRLFPMQPGRADAHRKLLAGWHETLRFHLGHRATQTGWRDFIDNEGCYAPGFVAFVRLHHPASPDYGKPGPTIHCPVCAKRVPAELPWLAECFP